MKNMKKIGSLCLALILAGCASEKPAPINGSTASVVQGTGIPVTGPLLEDAASRAQVDAFVQEMVTRHGFTAVQLDSLLSTVQKPAPREHHHGIAAPRTWAEYRAIFIRPDVIDAGARFMVQNQATLSRAETTYQVPPEIVAAIIGVETRYGQNLGKYKALDTLAWQAFMPNRRNHFYRHELEQYLLLCRENNWDPKSVYGSTAGAIGLGQFEPSSYRRIAVDFDGDGKRNLFTDPADAIGSIAHYFRLSHWRYGEPVATQASIAGTEAQQLVQYRPNPVYSQQHLSHYGIAPTVPLPAQLQSGLFVLDGNQGSEYWLTHTNFNVIKTYNKDNWYAMAVYQLSQELKAAVARMQATQPITAQVAQ